MLNETELEKLRLTKNEKLKLGKPVVIPEWAVEHKSEFAEAVFTYYKRGIDVGAELQLEKIKNLI